MLRDIRHDRIRRSLRVGGVFVLAGSALLGGGGSLEVGAARADTSASLMITYTTPTSLQVTLGDGTVVTSGSVVPAGSYEVHVLDDAVSGDLNPNIRVSGPGVTVASNLNTGMGIFPAAFGPFTFQTSSSYSIEDSILGASSLVTFTTTATSATGGGQTVGGTTGTASSGSSPGASSSPSSGGAALTHKALSGSVNSAGTPALLLNGRPLEKVKAGSYTVTIEDHSRKDGFILEDGSQRTVISGAAALGKHAITIMLRPGKWFFEASEAGRKFSFFVTAD